MIFRNRGFPICDMHSMISGGMIRVASCDIMLMYFAFFYFGFLDGKENPSVLGAFL